MERFYVGLSGILRIVSSLASSFFGNLPFHITQRMLGCPRQTGRGPERPHAGPRSRPARGRPGGPRRARAARASAYSSRRSGRADHPDGPLGPLCVAAPAVGDPYLKCSVTCSRNITTTKIHEKQRRSDESAWKHVAIKSTDSDNVENSEVTPERSMQKIRYVARATNVAQEKYKTRSYLVPYL